MKKIFVLTYLLAFSNSFSQVVPANYRLKYVVFKNDTILARDSNEVKAFCFRVAKISNPNMGWADSLYVVPDLIKRINNERTYSYEFKNDNTVFIAGISQENVLISKPGKYKVKRKKIVMKTKSDKKVQQQLILVNGQYALMREGKITLKFIFHLVDLNGKIYLMRKGRDFNFLYSKE